VFQEE